MSDPANPFQTPSEDEPGAGPEIESHGEFLIVRSPATLPNRCLITNAPTTPDDVLERTFLWRGRSFQLFTEPVTCDLTWSYSPQIRPAARWARIHTITVPAILIAVVATTIANAPELVVYAVGILGCLCGGYTGYKAFRAPQLHITDYKDGRFWFKGCGPKFLQQLEAESVSRH